MALRATKGDEDADGAEARFRSFFAVVLQKERSFSAAQIRCGACELAHPL